MFHIEEDVPLSDAGSSELRASTETSLDHESKTQNDTARHTSSGISGHDNTIELLDSASEDEDVFCTTAAVTREVSRVDPAIDAETAADGNNDDTAANKEVSNSTVGSLPTSKPAEITLIDSDDDENGDEISKVTLTAFEKTVRPESYLRAPSMPAYDCNIIPISSALTTIYLF